MEGETITCRLAKGGKIEVTFIDRVFPDRSAGQYEAGWWVQAPYKDIPNNFMEYFLSESGILYTWGEPHGPYDKICGYCIPWMRRAKQADSELEQFLKDELINRSFDAYR